MAAWLAWLRLCLILIGTICLGILLLPFSVPWTAALRANWDTNPGETLIVLGAEEVEGNLLGLHSYWRTAYSVYEWRQGQYRRIIMSGKGLATPMRDYAIAHGVPASAIDIEDKSLTTRQQALNVAAMCKPADGRLILLTSDFHSRRAQAAFRKAGLQVYAHPVPDTAKRAGQWQQQFPIFFELALESVKTLVYRWHGWI